MADASGSKMFLPRDAPLFSVQTPTLYTRNKYHAFSSNKSNETLFALNQELGQRVNRAREGIHDGKTIETSITRGKSHRIPKGVML